MKINPTLKLMIIGVGGAGNRVINQLITNSDNGDQATFIAIDHAYGTLATSKAKHILNLNSDNTFALVSFTKPSTIQKALSEKYAEISQLFTDTDVAIIVASFGGNVGTIATPVIAKAAKEMGVMTLSVITTPPHFEGSKRLQAARDGIHGLLEVCDFTSIIKAQDVLEDENQKIGMRKFFNLLSTVHTQAVTTLYKS